MKTLIQIEYEVIKFILIILVNEELSVTCSVVFLPAYITEET